MIRINLLPFRAARKKENIRRQVSIYLLSVLFLITTLSYFYIDYSGQLAAVKTQEAQKKKELEDLSMVVKRADQVKKNVELIRSRLGVIQSLEKQKRGPVDLLKEIALAVPTDKLWLRSLTEAEGILTLEGMAMDNDTVAVFMTSLEKVSLIRSVDLRTTRMARLEKHKVNVSEFILVCKTVFHKEAPKLEEKKDVRRRG